MRTFGLKPTQNQHHSDPTLVDSRFGALIHWKKLEESWVFVALLHPVYSKSCIGTVWKGWKHILLALFILFTWVNFWTTLCQRSVVNFASENASLSLCVIESYVLVECPLFVLHGPDSGTSCYCFGSVLTAWVTQHSCIYWYLCQTALTPTAHSERPKRETGPNALMLGFSFKGYFLFFLYSLPLIFLWHILYFCLILLLLWI